jgi:anti-sigma B factor antagonist
MANLNINERQMNDVTILDLEGDVTIGENSQKFRAAIRRLLGSNRRKSLLNLDELGYVDSSGLGEIVSGYNVVESEGGALKLENLTEHFQDIITITKLLTVFDTFESENEAVNSYK